MPYLPVPEKTRLDEGGVPHRGGELNYLVTKLCVEYIEQNGLDYQAINDVLGALDGASKEFYRRVAVPYEEVKCAGNGDVYPQGIVR